MKTKHARHTWKTTEMKMTIKIPVLFNNNPKEASSET